MKSVRELTDYRAHVSGSRQLINLYRSEGGGSLRTDEDRHKDNLPLNAELWRGRDAGGTSLKLANDFNLTLLN